MTEGNDLPAIAESKEDIQPSHQVQALRNEIKSFAGTVASLLEEKDQIINEQKEQLRIKEESFNFVLRQNNAFRERIDQLREIKYQLQDRISELEHDSDAESTDSVDALIAINPDKKISGEAKKS